MVGGLCCWSWQAHRIHHEVPGSAGGTHETIRDKLELKAERGPTTDHNPSKPTRGCLKVLETPRMVEPRSSHH